MVRKAKVKTDAQDITLEQLLESDIPQSTGENGWERMGVAKPVGVWFKVQSSSNVYRVVRNTEGGFTVAETREMKKQRTEREKTAVITCCECGAERLVASQDAHQVKRCKECQKKYRNHKRAERATE